MLVSCALGEPSLSRKSLGNSVFLRWAGQIEPIFKQALLSLMMSIR